jgi:hypothetical protein
VRRQGAVALLTFLIIQWVLSTFVFAQTTIIPSLTVSERYDSNIYWAPKATLSPGTKAEDFITMVVPQMTIAHAGSLMRGDLTGGALLNKYINNPERDFTGWNVRGRLDLTDAARQVSQRITTLTMRGTFVDSPATNGFAAAGGGLNTGFGAQPGAGAVGALNSGIVTNRASRQTYTLGVAGAYQLTGLTSLTSSYTYTNISFGNQQGGANNPLFDTTGHTGRMGINTRISPRDTVGASSAMSHYIQDQSSGGSGQGSYTTLTETLNWSRLWTQELSTFLAGGANLRLPVGSDIPGQSQELEVRPTVTARMIYSSYLDELREAGASEGPFDSLAGSLSPGGIMVPGAYRVLMTYRYSFVPSYAFSSGPSQAHVLGLTVMGGITSKLTGQVGMNYAHRNTLSGPSSTGDTVGLTGGVRYLLGPVMASLTANWLYVSNSTTQTPVYEFSKEMVMLSFSYAFLSPAFFYEDISLPSSIGTGTSPSGDGSETLGKE